MDISELKIGALLEIYIQRDGYNYKVVSKIEYADKTLVGVTPIASRRKLFQFKKTDVVDIVYRIDEKTWKWEKVKPGIATLDDDTKLHVFRPVSNAEIFNRRSTYRLPINEELTIKYEVIEDIPSEKGFRDLTPELTLDNTLDEISKRYKEYECVAFIKDISEGGAAISSDVRFSRGDVVSFVLNAQAEPVRCRAIVVRVKHDEKSYFTYHYGLSFIETSNNFVKYFYSEQRKRLLRRDTP